MYKDYGAKGILVCEEWHNRDNFRKWANENGYSKGMRLERIDAKKGYEPSNCRFGFKYKKEETNSSQKSKKIRKHRLEMIEYAGLPKSYCKMRIYRIFVGMHTRCENENRECYPYYGGRGIKVCDNWSGNDGFFHFYKWSMENGYTDDLTIDRIDSDGNYEPNNCRWATMEVQVQNRKFRKKKQ